MTLTRTARTAGFALVSALVLAGCQATPTGRGDGGEEVVITDFAEAPPGARAGACYGKDVTPAVIEQVTERALVQEPQFGPEGNVITPARYEEHTTSQVVQGREEIYFETPCPPRWTPDFIASVQRALSARGLYAGAPDGVLSPATRQAIRAFQISRGLNSGILSTESARALGLVEVDLEG